MMNEPVLRLANLNDVPALTVLIDSSVRGLQVEDYSVEQMEAALATVFGVDTQLIEDGTYFVMTVGSEMVACGGWSKRKTLFGSDHAHERNDALLDPTLDAAKIRAFFVHPDWARKGFGTKILEACEGAARGAGFSHFELGATLTGVRLYAARGYVLVERVDVAMGNGVFLPVVRMIKSENGQSN